jgi:hypothetical protein
MDAKVRDLMTPGPIGVGYHQSIGEADPRDLEAMQALAASARPFSLKLASLKGVAQDPLVACRAALQVINDPDFLYGSLTGRRTRTATP